MSVNNHPHLYPIAYDEIQGSSLLQSSEWAHVKSAFGWKVYGYRQTKYSTLESEFIVLVRHIKGLGDLAYIPDGILPPSLIAITGDTSPSKEKTPQHQNESLEHSHLHALLHDSFMLLSEVYTHLSAQTTALLSIRWDMPWVVHVVSPAHHGGSTSLAHGIHSLKTQYHNIRTPHYTLVCREPTQPPATVLLDLTQDEETLLSHMKSKTRYNIALSQKKEVQVKEGIGIDEFYMLYEQTSKRNNIAIHSKEYYEKVLQVFRKSASGKVYIYGAWFEGVLLAAIVVAHYQRSDAKKEAVYLYGASSNLHRNRMPTYALQWHAIRHAKQLQCGVYDMFGISLADDDTARMHGVYRFKMGFGGRQVARIGAFDIYVPHTSSYSLVSRLRYRCFLLLENIRNWYYYTYRKR